MSNGTSRRELLKAMGLGVAAYVGAGCAGRMIGTSHAHPHHSHESVRIAHFTDIHVQPELDAARGMAKCLHHIQSLTPKVDLILNTGDCVMDALGADRARMQTQWDVWNAVLRNELSVAIESCIGNHDIWGWAKDRSGTSGAEPGWGKRMVMDQLKLARPYHAFDRGAWRIIMLDSCQATAEGVWFARIDDEQFAWLEGELAATRKPVLIASHVPIMSPSIWLDSGRIAGTPEAPALAVRRMHTDSKRFGELFRKHLQVKLCISGHLHQIDRADFHGVTYITNPAVCGDWWKGLHRGVWGEMYTTVDLHPDGTFDYAYVDYGWEPVPNSTS